MKRKDLQNYANIEPFEKHTEKYEDWFERNKYAYISELKAVEKLFGKCHFEDRCLEVGVGTARFAAPLKIKEGVEPSREMAKIARKRGVKVKTAVAENLPYPDNRFDKVLMVTTICFVKDPLKSLEEVHRVLKPGGKIVIGFVDKDSFLGQKYLQKKDKSLFYKPATFFSADEIKEMLLQAGFENLKFVQTIFKDPGQMQKEDPVKEGYGEGAFVVVKATKPIPQELSKVEVKGLEARFYDALLDIITLGAYARFLKDALSRVELKNNMKIAEFGAGTCRNLKIIAERARKEGKTIKATAFEIGQEMLRKCLRRSRKFPEIEIIKRSILEEPPTKLKKNYDAIIISFVFHGFTQENREKILSNAAELLREGGKVYLIDYSPIDLDRAPLLARLFFKKAECPLALDYIRRNKDDLFSKFEFVKETEEKFLKDIVSLSVYRLAS